MIWNELKEFCNSLPEDQLNMKVVMLREEESISNIETERLQDDYYMGDDDDFCYPESDAQYPLNELKKVWSKGDAILWEKL